MAGTEPNATVIHRDDLTPELCIVRVRAEGWELPEFKPGQFGVLGLPPSAPRSPFCDEEEEPPKGPLIRRAYSVASSSVARSYLEFYIALVRSGALTPRIFALREGDPIWLGPKITGMFTLDEVPEEQNVVFVGTGTGLAPYMSMLRSAIIHGSRRRFAVLHGARHSWDLGYRSELLTLKRMSPNFAYFPVVDPGQKENEKGVWDGHFGYVQDFWNNNDIAEAWQIEPTPENTHVFLCGNPFMIEDMLVLLGKRGFEEHTKKKPGTIHLERFW